MHSGRCFLFFLAVAVLLIGGTTRAHAYAPRPSTQAIPSSPILHVAAKCTYPVEEIHLTLETQIGLFASGDPVNFIDADGRFGKGISSGWSGSIAANSPNSSAFSAGLMFGGAASGAGSGAQNGAGGSVNALTFGNYHGAFGSDSSSSEYAMGRNITYGGMATVAVVGTGGLALEAAGGATGLYVGATNAILNPMAQSIAAGISGTSYAGAEYLAAKNAAAAIASKTAPRAFWMGKDGLQAAQAAGCQTMQASEKALAAARAGDLSLLRAESAAWAKGASGEMSVFVGKAAQAGKGGDFFWEAELPTLLDTVNQGAGTIKYNFLN